MSKSTEDQMAQGCAVFILAAIAQIALSFLCGWIAYLVFDAFFSHDFSVWPFIGSVYLIFCFTGLLRGGRKPLNLSASDNR